MGGVEKKVINKVFRLFCRSCSRRRNKNRARGKTRDLEKKMKEKENGLHKNKKRKWTWSRKKKKQKVSKTLPGKLGKLRNKGEWMNMAIKTKRMKKEMVT